MIHRLRPAESSDFDWMLTLPQPREEARVPLAERRRRFARVFAAQSWWVVEVDRKPVGALSVSWDDDPAVLHAVALDPAWQGRGLGTRLVHDVMLDARELRRGVAVELAADDPTLPLFRRLGFWPSGETTIDPTHVRLRWQASVRTDETLRAAMAPWEDPQRRRAWARRLFEPPPNDEVGFIRFAMGRYGVSAGASVLVMGCGVGGLLRPLAARGLHVTAYEPDGDLHAAASRTAAMLVEPITVRAGGLLDLDDAGVHDVAVAFGGVLWSLETHAHRVDAARRLRRALRPGGVLLVEGPNMPWVLQANRQLPVGSEIYHRATVTSLPLEDTDLHDGVLIRKDTIVVAVDEEEVAEWHETRRQALLGLPFLRLALEEAGFARFETFWDFHGTGPSKISGEQIVLTARTPA